MLDALEGGLPSVATKRILREAAEPGMKHPAPPKPLERMSNRGAIRMEEMSWNASKEPTRPPPRPIQPAQPVKPVRPIPVPGDFIDQKSETNFAPPPPRPDRKK